MIRKIERRCVPIIKVLIVEDDQSILRLLQILLEGTGLEIVGTALNGQMAIEIFKKLNDKPDIILMDYRMPIKNGIDASIEILKMNFKTKIIFTTADDEISDKALQIGVYKVLIKPFDFDDLLKIISKAMDK